MTIAVTGATGFVGQMLLDVAAKEGIGLRALARKPQAPRDGVEWVAGDLGEVSALDDLVRGAEAVIHLAGLTTAPDAAAFEAGNVTGTLNLVEAAVREGVPRMVFVSSLAAREPALSQYGASKARAEKLVKASHLDWTIVRPPAVYGPRDKDMLELFKAARWGVVPVPPKGRSSLIHAEDLARLLLALIPGGEAVTHKTFEPDDGKRGGWSHYELARAIGWAMGQAAKGAALAGEVDEARGAGRHASARRQGQADTGPGGLYGSPGLGGQPECAGSFRHLASEDRNPRGAEGDGGVVSGEGVVVRAMEAAS